MAILYFNNAVSQDPDNILNYWQDAGCTTPALALPTWTADTVHAVSGATLYDQPMHTLGLDVGGSLIGDSGSTLRFGVNGRTTGGSISAAAGAAVTLDAGVTVTINATGVFDIDPAATITAGAGAGIHFLYGASVSLAGLSLTSNASGSTVNADNVRAGVTYNGVTGNLIVPAASILKTGEVCGWHHTGPTAYEVTGTFPTSTSYTDPGVANVRSGVTYVFAGATLSGIYTMTAVGVSLATVCREIANQLLSSAKFVLPAKADPVEYDVSTLAAAQKLKLDTAATTAVKIYKQRSGDTTADATLYALALPLVLESMRTSTSEEVIVMNAVSVLITAELA